MPVDKWFEVLSSYDGSINDRKKAFLVATEGYNNSLSVQDMEFRKLGSLGYTGGLADRWFKYLVALGGSGSLQDMLEELLDSTFYAGSSGGAFSSAFSSAFDI